MRFKKFDVSITEEKLICTGLIVSSQFCSAIKGSLDPDYFKNSYLRQIASWAIWFYDEHGKAPYKHINNVFEAERANVNEADAELIDELLTEIGNSYAVNEDINVEYLMNEAERYFRIRELEIHINNIAILKDQGDIEAAEKEISRFNRVSIKLDENIYINPGDEATRERIYRKRDENQQTFFKYPGDLGLFIGNMAPGDVVGITAPQKKGKSFLLEDIHKHATLQKIKALKFSIEMTDIEELTRFDKLFAPSVNTERGYYKYPVFDCVHNQTGSCGERNSKVIIRPDEKSEPIENPNHVICTKCKDDQNEHSRFLVSVYQKEIFREKNTYEYIKKKIQSRLKLFNAYTRIVVRPKYSLTYDLMMRDVEIFASRYNYIPRMLLLDYVDILQIASIHDDYKLEDEKWRLLQKIAGATGCLIITATQGNKASFQAANIKSTDQSGYYGKGRHVNLMMAINQGSWEKKQGLWRLGVTDSRSGYQNDEDSCFVLQDLRAGQMHLESYWPGKFEIYGRR